MKLYLILIFEYFDVPFDIEKFENTGHYITLEKPKIINNMITKWIKSISFFKI